MVQLAADHFSVILINFAGKNAPYTFGLLHHAVSEHYSGRYCVDVRCSLLLPAVSRLSLCVSCARYGDQLLYFCVQNGSEHEL